MDARGFGKQLAALYGAIATLVAAGTGDNTEVNGEVIDRENAHSAVVVVTARAVLTDTETLTVKLTVQEGDESDGSDMADVAAALQPEGAAASTVITLTSDGGTTETGVYKLSIDLSSLKRYVRVQVLPDLSAGATDTAQVAAAVLLGGLVIEQPA